MKPVIIIAIAFLLIPSIIYADHATTYNEHWDSLCQYDYDKKMKNVEEQFKDDKFMNFHNDLLQKCLDEFYPLEIEVIPDDDIIHPTCDLSCLPENYEFGTNRIQDKDVLVCFDKWWKGGSLISLQCPESPQFDEFNSKYAELKQVWEEVYQTSNTPEFYPMEPYFRQFTDADAFCLLESEDYKDCLLESHGALENMKADSGWMYTVLYQGCHNTARNLMVSEEMTREEASYVFNVCEVFPDYILEVRETIPEIILQLIPEPTPELTPEPTPELIPEPIPEPTPEPIPKLTPEPTPEPIPELTPEPKPEAPQETEVVCGTGTIEKNGQCVPEHETMVTEMQQKSSKGGGCLIATATYGTELAPQVQQLRELRDNKLLNTESGSVFMNTFNDFYYSFSPIIADYERENPVFKELVKIAITPMISSLSILNYVDMDSEVEVLGYGISLILLNVGMYIGIPVLVIVKFRKGL